jgi:hypothetical protein
MQAVSISSESSAMGTRTATILKGGRPWPEQAVMLLFAANNDVLVHVNIKHQNADGDGARRAGEAANMGTLSRRGDAEVGGACITGSGASAR